MKTRERMGYASHVRERRCESCRYGVRPELDTAGVESYPGGGDIQRTGGGETDMVRTCCVRLIVVQRRNKVRKARDKRKGRKGRRNPEGKNPRVASGHAFEVGGLHCVLCMGHRRVDRNFAWHDVVLRPAQQWLYYVILWASKVTDN